MTVRCMRAITRCADMHELGSLFRGSGSVWVGQGRGRAGQGWCNVLCMDVQMWRLPFASVRIILI